MCTSPIWIKNKGYRKDDPLSPYRVQVPCGHCDDCKEALIASALFRADWHTTFVRDVMHGSMVFVTLTFNNRCLNVVKYCDMETGEVRFCSTWNNALLHKFVKRLKKDVSCCVDYIVTSERGHDGTYIDKFGNTRLKTRRPHYHCIFWFYNSDASPLEYTSEELYKKVAFYWSTFDKRTARYKNKRVQCVIDLTTDKALPPYTYCRANIEPIGRVYNESVQRSEEQAIKYVIKYVFKDAQDVTFNIRPMSIISTSTAGISYNDMRPRLYQSTNIGVYFYELNCGSLSPCEVGEFLATYQGRTSDDETTCVPRYYIQKYGQSVTEVSRKYVYDDVETWNSYGFGHRPSLGRNKKGEHIDKVIPITPDGGVCWSDYRWQIETKRLPNEIGRAFSSKLHELRVADSYQALQAFAHSDLDFPERSALKPLGNDLYNRATWLCENYADVARDIRQYLCPLGVDAFSQLYDMYYHSNNFDELLLSSNADSVEVKTWRSLECFLLLNALYNAEHKAQSALVNALEYERNAPQYARKMPHVFNNPKNTKDDED